MYHLVKDEKPICGANYVVSLEPEGFCPKCREMTARLVVTIETTVDPGWVDFVTGSNMSGDGVEGSTDIFMRGYSGYWLCGAEHDPKLGWLAYDSEELSPTDPRIVAVIKAWRAGNKLPEHWYALNCEVAERAWVAGFKRWGEKWYEEGDGERYDWALQVGLLGKAVYG